MKMYNLYINTFTFTAYTRKRATAEVVPVEYVK